MIPCKYVLITSLLLTINIVGLSGQAPVVTTPQVGTLSPNIITGAPTNKNNPAPNTPVFSGFNNNNKQVLDMYERDRLEMQRRDATNAE